MLPGEYTFDAMKVVTLRELKNRLSGYLREIAQGEVVLITAHGRVVAELRPPPGELPATTLAGAPARLHAAGALTPGPPQDKAAYRRTRVRLDDGTQQFLVPVPDHHLERLLRQGIVRWSGGKPRGARRPPRIKGPTVAQAVIADRR